MRLQGIGFSVKRANELTCPITLLLQLVPRSPWALEGVRRQGEGRHSPCLLWQEQLWAKKTSPSWCLRTQGRTEVTKPGGARSQDLGETRQRRAGSARDPKGRFGKGTGEKAHQGLGGRTTAPGMEKRSFNFLRYQGVSQPYTPVGCLRGARCSSGTSAVTWGAWGSNSSSRTVSTIASRP